MTELGRRSLFFKTERERYRLDWSDVTFQSSHDVLVTYLAKLKSKATSKILAGKMQYTNNL